MAMEIYLLGCNHKTAEVDFREKIAIIGETLPHALKELVSLNHIEEGVILSTCNRTEIYVSVSDPADIFNQLEEFLSQITGTVIERNSHLLYRMMGEKAIHHLFQVASGVDSLIVGEPQILGQVKESYRVACENSTTGVLLNRLMNHSFSVGKRVRSETALGAGAVSVAYAAVELAQKIFRDLSQQKVLLIGAGETGELTARHLREKGIGTLYITNRTASKAEELAIQLQGEAVAFENMSDFFPAVDIIIGAATAPNYLILRQDIEKVLQKRRSRPLFLIDIGMPRNFDPAINKLESVFLHDMDDMEQIVTRNLEKRRKEIPRAEAIISQEVQNFLEWKRGLQITPTIVSLRKKLEDIRQQELQKHKNRLTEEEIKKVDLISRAILNKILHQPMVQLKKYGNGHPDGLLRIDVVRELFGLEDKE
ncbi:MAG: glutamyl-tRNA reductase [Calditrichia bacterium]